MKEKYIESQILTWLNMQPNVFAFKVNTTGYYDPKLKTFRKNSSQYLIKGTADIIGCYHGRFLAIEVKSKEGFRKFQNNPGQHELNQIAFLLKVREAGGIGLCVCSLDEVIAQIFQLERDRFKSYSTQSLPSLSKAPED